MYVIIATIVNLLLFLIRLYVSCYGTFPFFLSNVHN